MLIRTLFSIIVLLTSLDSASAQKFELDKGDTINRRDASDFKQGWWKIFNREGKFKGYADGQVVEEGDYVNNKKSGVWTKYYPTGGKKHELTFANNVANGFARIYYRNGQLQEEGIWQQNKWSGQYKYYHENGNLKYDWNYNSSGKREGEQKYFHENGMLQYLGDWKNGNEAGQLLEYYDDGSLKAKRFFNEGKVDEAKTENIAQGKTYDQNIKKYTGKPAPKVMARGEIIDGFNRVMNADGSLSKEGSFKDKRLIDGKELIYEGGKVVKVVLYKDGKRTGEEGVK